MTEYRIDGAAAATDTLGSHSMYSASGSITTTTLPNTVYTYDPAGNLQTETLPNGMVQTYTYNDLNRLTGEAVTEGANNIETFSYPSYTADGQRKTEVDSVYNTGGTLLYTNSFGWTYDGDNRLKTETLTAGTGSPDTSYTDAYTYDSVGNRLTKVHTVGTNVTTITDSYDTNGDDRLMTETATGTGAYTTNYTYDNNGSMKSETRTGTGATTNTYIYDVQNHLTSATIGGTTTTYAYDAGGNRVSSTQGASTTYYTIDDINPTGYSQVIEQAATLGGTPTTSYVIGQALLGQANSSGVLSYLATDGHGSTRILATAAGGITSRYDFDAFGNALTATTGTQILYSGQFLDSATGLYDLRARNYDPTTGRFTSFDSFAGYASDPSSLPKYLYVADNPITNIDPSGHQLAGLIVSIGIASVISGSVGGIFGGLQHGLIGAVAGFAGAATGTAVSLSALPIFASVIGPISLPVSFGLGSAVGTVLETVISDGTSALTEESTWGKVAASFVIGSFLGTLGSDATQMLTKEVEESVASSPAVWKLLGNIQNGITDADFDLSSKIANSGLTQDFGTLVKLYAPKFASIAKELTIESFTDKSKESIVTPVVNTLVDFVDDLFLKRSGDPSVK